MVRSTSLLLALCLFSSAAPVVGPELPIAEPVIGRAGDNQQYAAVASSGGPGLVSGYVVWEDRRDGRSVDLWGTRLGAAAAVLDATGVPLVRAPLAQTRPALGVVNDTLLLVWVDESLGGCGGEVRGQRFDAALSAVGPALTLSTGACNPGGPAIAADAAGAGWLVTWGGHGAQQEVHGALVLVDGTIGRADFVIGAGPNSALAPAVAATSSGFLVAWEDDRASPANVLVVPVSAAGAVGAVSTPWPSATRPQRQPALAHNAGQVLLAWTEGGTDVRAGVVSLLGAAASGPFTVRAGTTAVSAPRAVEAATGAWLVAWNDQRAASTAVYGRRIEANGGASAELALSGPAGSARTAVAVAANGAELLAVFHGDAPDYVNGRDVMGTRVLASDLGFDPSLVGTPALPLSTSATRQRQPNAAWNGEVYFVGWRDDGINAAGSDLVGQLLTAAGQRLVPDAGVRLTTSSAILSSYASVAGCDAGFFVTWGDNGSETSLRGRRVTAAGVPLDTPAPVLNDRGGFVVDHDSRWFIDSWVTVFKQSFNAELALRRTGLDAGVAEAELLLGSVGSAGSSLRTAQSGAQLLVVLHGASDAGLDVIGALWRHDAGVVLPPTSLTPGRAGNQTNPAAAGGPSHFLVVWTEPGPLGDGDVFARRVSQAGAVLDAPVLLSGAGVDAFPTVAWTGQSYLVGWVRDDAAIVGVRVAEDGAVLDAAPFVLAASVERQALPRLVSGPAGESLLTYEVFDPALPWRSFAARARFVREPIDADAGVADAGVADAGGVDAGGADAGVDAGTPGEDGGVEPGDAGVEVPAEPRVLTVGCGCGGGEAGLGGLLLILLVRRRRSASAAEDLPQRPAAQEP